MRTHLFTTAATFAALAAGAAAASAQPAYVAYDDAMHMAQTDWTTSTTPMMASLDGTSPTDAYLYTASASSAYGSPHATASASHDKPRRYPRAVVDRPFVIPFKVALATADLVSVGDALDAVVAAQTGLPHGVDLSAAIDHPLGTTPGDGKVSAGSSIRLYGSARLSVAARTRLDVDSKTGELSTSVTGLRVAAILAKRYAVWMRPEQLVVDIAGSAPAKIVVPVSAAVQLTPTLWVQADADVQAGVLQDHRLVRASIDSVPLGIGAVVSLASCVDLRAGISADVGSHGIIAPSSRWMFGLAYIIGG